MQKPMHTVISPFLEVQFIIAHFWKISSSVHPAAAAAMTPCIKAHQQVVEWFAQEVNDYAYNYDKLFIHLNWRWIDLMSSPQEFSFFWFLWLEKSAGNAQMFHGFWILLGFPNKNCKKKEIVNMVLKNFILHIFVMM